MHDEEILFLRKPHVLVCDLWGGAASTELTSHGRNAKMFEVCGGATTHTAWARVLNAHSANVLPVMWTLAIFEKVTLTIFVHRLT